MSAGREDSPEQRELEELLRRVPREAVDPEARARARALFLAAGRAAEASQGEGPVRSGTVMDGASEQAFELWLARVLVPEGVQPEVRARARAAFLSGLAERGGARPPAPRRLRFFALALAAAGVLAVTFLLPEAPRWRVELLTPVAFEEEEFGLQDEGRLASSLERSGRIVTREAPTRLALSDALELELRAGTTVFVPVLPELDGGTPIVFELEAGECLLRTRAGWRGNPLFVRTPFGDVRATGTTFGVLVTPECMCVCVAEGTVEVDGGGRIERVEARTSLLVSRQGDPARTPFSSDPTSPERDHLEPLQAFEREP